MTKEKEIKSLADLEAAVKEKSLHGSLSNMPNCKPRVNWIDDFVPTEDVLRLIASLREAQRIEYYKIKKEFVNASAKPFHNRDHETQKLVEKYFLDDKLLQQFGGNRT